MNEHLEEILALGFDSVEQYEQHQEWLAEQGRERELLRAECGL